MPPLSEEEVQAALAGLPGWELGDGELVKTFKFPTFMDAIEFINRVAEVAEAANHHPDIENHHNRVRLGLYTWSQGAVTQRDVALAREIESVASVV
jgi:4a-hydroxytetrahydrobiopterin dehydratase